MKTLSISFNRGAFVIECGNARLVLANDGSGSTVIDGDAYTNLLDEMRGERIRARYADNLKPMGLHYLAEQLRKNINDLIGKSINWPMVEAREKVYNAFTSAGIGGTARVGAIEGLRYRGIDPTQSNALASAWVGLYHEIERFKRAGVDSIVADSLETPLEWEQLYRNMTPNRWKAYRLASKRVKCEHDRALLLQTIIKSGTTNNLTDEQTCKAYEMLADAINSGEYLNGSLGRMTSYFDTRYYHDPNDYIHTVERGAARYTYELIESLVKFAEEFGIGLRFPFTDKDASKTVRAIIEAAALRMAKGQHFAGAFHDAMNGFECAGLCVVVPETFEDFQDEAKQQNNCVASYYEQAREGKTNICFIRLKNEKQNSLLTCEVSNSGKIVQFLAKNNKKPNMNDENISTFLHAFMDKIAQTFNEID